MVARIVAAALLARTVAEFLDDDARFRTLEKAMKAVAAAFAGAGLQQHRILADRRIEVRRAPASASRR